MSSLVIQLRQEGVITIPTELRHRYGLNEGDFFTLVDLGDGSFLLAPGVSKVDHLLGEVERVLAEEDVDLEDLLKALDLERKSYYREHYVQQDEA